MCSATVSIPGTRSDSPLYWAEARGEPSRYSDSYGEETPAVPCTDAHDASGPAQVSFLPPCTRRISSNSSTLALLSIPESFHPGFLSVPVQKSHSAS